MPRHYSLEALEARLLLSADAMAGLSEAVEPSGGPQAVEEVQIAQATSIEESMDVAGGQADVFGDVAAIDLGEDVGDVPEPTGAGSVEGGAPGGSLVFGSQDLSEEITLGGDAVGVVDLSDYDVVVRGDRVTIGSFLQAHSLTIIGDGSTIELMADIDVATDVLYEDSVVVFGDRTVESDGRIRFTNPGTVTGGNAGTPDSLTLIAAGEIFIEGAIAGADPLQDLTVDAGGNVSFDDSIVLDGDLTITGANTITFGGSLDIGGTLDLSGFDTVVFDRTVDIDGNLIVDAAANIVFEGDVDVAGSVEITGFELVWQQSLDTESFYDAQVTNRILHEGRFDAAGDILLVSDEIDFTGGVESVSSPGTISLRPFTADTDIRIGRSATGEPNILDFIDRDINALQNGFTRIIVGIDVGDVGTVTVESSRFIDDLTIVGEQVNVIDTLDVVGNLRIEAVNDGDAIDHTVTLDGENFAPDLTQRNGEVKATGDITIIAADDIIQQERGNITVTIAGTIDVQSTGGAITMQGDSVSRTNGGNIFYQANGDVVIGLLDARSGLDRLNGVMTGQATTWAFVTIYSDTAGIADEADGDAAIDIYAQGVRMDAFAGVGALGDGTAGRLETEVATLAARTIAAVGGTGIAVRDATAIAVDSIAAVTVTRVGIDGTLSNRSDASELSDVAATGNGSILLSNLTGDISLFAGQDGDLVTVEAAGSGAVTISAPDGRILMDDETRIETGTGAITLEASSDIELSVLDSTSGNISVEAGLGASASGAIIDNLTSSEDANIVTSGAVTLVAETGVGVAGTGDIDTTVGSLSASNRTSGDIVIEETAGLELTGAETLAANGDISVTVVTGALDVSGDVTAHGDGDLLFVVSEALAGMLALDAALATTSGVINAIAGGTISLTANGNVTVDTNPGTIYLASGASILMDAASGIQTDGANIYLSAAGGIAAATVDARTNGNRNTGSTANQAAWGSIALEAAGGSITDVRPGATTATALFANALKLSAAGAGVTIGEASNALNTEVATIAADAVASIFLSEATAIAVADTGDISILTINALLDGFGTQTASGSSDLRTSGPAGTLALVTVDGSITLNDGSSGAAGEAVSGGGETDILIGAAGDGSNVTLNAGVLSAGGSITIIAAASVLFNGGSDVETQGAGTIDIEATAGSIDQSTTSDLIADDGDIRMLAAGDVTIGGQIETASGSVSITAQSGSILDADTDGGNDVIAVGLRLDAAAGIGALAPDAENPLEVTVATVSARAGPGGIALAENNDLNIDDAGATVQRVGLDAVLTPVTDATQADLLTTTNGPIVLSVGGALTINDGTVPDDSANPMAVLADGSGNVLLDAAGSITVDATVASGTGDLTISGTALTFLNGADVATTGSGTIQMVATAGGISLSASSDQTSTSGDILLSAQADISLGGEVATAGNVRLVSAAGSVVDGDGAGGVDIRADGLRIEAANAVGSLGTGTTNAIETAVSVVAVRAGAGGVSLEESDTISVDDVALLTRTVDSDATTTEQSVSELADLRTTANGSIILRTLAGTITLEDGSDPDDSADPTAVVADGSGNVLIAAEGAGTSILANADVDSGTGNLSLIADSSMTFSTGVDASTGSAGTIDLEATTGTLNLSTTSVLTTGTGDIRLLADGTVTLGGVIATAGSAAITSASASILDGDNDAGLDIDAAAVRFTAANAVGALGAGAVNPVETSVDTLSATAGAGGISLAEADAVTVSDVSATVNRVAATGEASGVGTGDQADLRTVADGSIVLTAAGTITLLDGTVPDDSADPTVVSANGAGNILIQATGAGSNISSAADIDSGSGFITISAANDVTFLAGADVETPGADGDIVISAVAGDLSFSTTSNQTSGSGTVRFFADGNVTLGGVLITSGDALVESASASIIDGDGTTSVDIIAAQVHLTAANAVGELGAGTNAIDTTVATVTASAGAGGISLLETDGIAVEPTTIASASVTSNGETGTIQTFTDADLTTTANGGIVLRTLNGDISAEDTADSLAVSADGSGNILIQALGAGTSITLVDGVSSGSGDISILADTSIAAQAGASVSTGTTGTVDLEATNGTLTLSTTSNVSSGSGDIRLLAASTVMLGGLVSTTGAVSVTSQTDSILDGDADAGLDIDATQLRLSAGIGIGTLGAGTDNAVEIDGDRVSARGGSGGINLAEATSVSVDDTSASINRVDETAATTPVGDGTQADLRTSAGGSIVLDAVGSLTLNAGTVPAEADATAVVADTSGNILLNAGASILGNADVDSGTGNISILATGDVTFTADADVGTGGSGTLDIEATTGSVLFSTTSNQTASTGDIRIFGGVDVTLGGVGSTTADISVTAGSGSILDGDADGSVSGTLDLIASQLRLSAGTGVGTLGDGSDEAIETDVAIISARAGSGGINVYEDDAITVDDTSVTVNRVVSDATTTPETDATQADLRTSSAGSIVLITDNGSITLNDGTAPDDSADPTAVSADTTGNVLVQAKGFGRDIFINADVDSGGGSISVLAPDTITVTTDADIDTTDTGTIDIEAVGGPITFSISSNVRTGDANIRIRADDDITLGGIVSTTAQVSISTVSGSILDREDGDTVDISATDARLFAGNGIGELGTDFNPVEITVERLTASAGNDGISLLETDSVVVNDVEVTVDRVQPDATVDDIMDANQSDLETSSNGPIVLRTTDGSITLDDGTAQNVNTAVSAADGLGNVLIEARGASGDIIANADILGGGANVSIIAERSIVFTTDADITTSSLGTIDLVAFDGSITLSPTSDQTTGFGDIRMEAEVDITLGGQANTNGSFSAIATTGSILDGDGDGDNAASVDIDATDLRLWAFDSIGELGAGAANPIETSVLFASARAGAGGISLRESLFIVIDDTSAEIRRVQSDASDIAVTDDAQSDLRTADGTDGSIVLRTAQGNITLNDGNAPGDDTVTASGGDDTVVFADGAGNILIEALGDGTRIDAFADIVSGTGNISVIADTNVEVHTDVDVTTGGSGDIDIEATDGFLRFSTTSDQTTGSGDVRFNAELDVTLGGTTTTSGNVSITSKAASILDGDDGAGLDIVSNGLRLGAAVGVGELGGSVDPIETSVDQVSARADSAGISLLEADGITVGDMAVTVDRVLLGADTLATTDATQADLRTTSNGAIVLRTTLGNITLDDGTAPDNSADPTAVVADGTGNILLQALDAQGSITGNADVDTGTGVVTILAGLNITFTAGADISTSGTGTILLDALGGFINLSTTSDQTAADGNIVFLADGDITLGGTATTNLTFAATSTTGSILDADTDEGLDISADLLRLSAFDSIGQLGDIATLNPVETAVAEIAAVAGAGGISLREADEISVTSVSASANVVVDDATLGTARSLDQLSHLTTRAGTNGSIVLRTTNGDIFLTDGNLTDDVSNNADGSGNILVQAIGADTNIFITDDVLSGTGNISILAGNDIRFTENGDVITGGGGAVDLRALNGELNFDQTARAASGSGNMSFWASGDVTIGIDFSTGGDMSLISEDGSIVDGDLDGSAGTVDLIADGLMLFAGLNVGNLGAGIDNALETRVTTVTALAESGDVALYEEDSITVSNLSIILPRVDPGDFGNSLVIIASQDDLTSEANGSIVLRTENGDILLERGDPLTLFPDDLSVSGGTDANILIQPLAAGTSVTVRGSVVSGGGNISILAPQDIAFENGASVATSGTGSIDLFAETGAITLSPTSDFTVDGSGDVRMVAFGDILLGGVIDTEGMVSLISDTGSILDQDESTVDIIAEELRIVAESGSIGTLGVGTDNAIETTVEDVAASAGSGGIHLTETDSVQVTATSASIERVQFDATVDTVSDDDLSDLRTNTNGSITLTSTGGQIALADGRDAADDADPVSVAADGTGNVRIANLGAVVGISTFADVLSGTGNITLISDADIDLNSEADVVTAGAGTVVLDATGGSITMVANSRIEAADGDIRLSAEDDIQIGETISTNANASLTARLGSITDADSDGSVDIFANTLRLNAGTGVGFGSSANAIETDVAILTGRSGSGGFYLIETDGLTITDAAAAVDVVQVDSSVVTETEAIQSDLIVSNGGLVDILVETGTLTVNDGTSGGEANLGIRTDGAGTITLTVGSTGVAGDFAINTGITSDSGDILITAPGNATLSTIAADISILSSAGSITLDTTGDLTIGDGVTIRTFDGDIAIDADALTVGNGLIAVASSGVVDINAAFIAIGNTAVISGLGGVVTITSASTLTIGDFAQIQTQDAYPSIVGPRGVFISSHGSTIIGESLGIQSSANVEILVDASVATPPIEVTIGQDASVVALGGAILVDIDGPVDAGSVLGDLTTSIGANSSFRATGPQADYTITIDATHQLDFASGILLESLNGSVVVVNSGVTNIGDANTFSGESVSVFADARFEAPALADPLVIGNDFLIDGNGGDVAVLSDGSITIADRLEIVTALRVEVAAGFALTIGDDASITSTNNPAASSAIAITTGAAMSFGNNAAISATSGSLTLDSEASILFGNNARVETGSGPLTVTTGTTLDYGDLASILTGSGTITLNVGTALTFGNDASIVATDSPEDGAALSVTSVQSIAFGNNATVSAAFGSLTLDSQTSILFGDDARLYSASGLLTVMAGTSVTFGDSAIVGFGTALVLNTGAALSFGDDASISVGTEVSENPVMISAVGQITFGDRAVIEASNGSVTITSLDAITFGADASISNVDAIEITADADVAFGDGALLETEQDSLEIDAAGDIVFGESATVESDSGSIMIEADGALIFGDDLTATTNTGPILWDAVDGFTLGANAAVTSSAAPIDIETDGDIAVGAGSLVDSVGNATTVDAGGSIDIGADSTVRAGDGSLSVSAGDAMDLATGVVLESTAATAPVTITAGLGGITMADSSRIQSSGAVVSVEAVGDVILAHVGTSADAFVRSTGGGIFDAGDTDVDAAVGGTLTLDGSLGIGMTGVGALEIAVGTLVARSDTGSVYVNSTGVSTVSVADISASGSLFISHTQGMLTLGQTLRVANGGLYIDASTVAVTVSDNATVTASGDIRIRANAYLQAAATVTSMDGNIAIAAIEPMDFAAGSLVQATTGSVAIRGLGDIDLGSVTAGALIDIRADGDIQSNGTAAAPELLTAQTVRLFALGQIGMEANPIRTVTDRMDLQAGLEAFVDEANGLEIGRFGVKLISSTVNDKLKITMGAGTLGSAGGIIEHEGEGTLIIESDEQIGIDAQIVARFGNITFIADSIVDETSAEAALFTADSGKLTLTLQNGAGGTGAEDIDISVVASEATTVAGSMYFEALDSLRIVDNGLATAGGSGEMNLVVSNGNLTVASLIDHAGDGPTNVTIDAGRFIMELGSEVAANTGALNISAEQDFIVTRITSAAGSMFLESVSGSILRDAGFNGNNILATVTPVIEVDRIVDLLVDSDRVVVNGDPILRRNDPIIRLFLVF